MDIRLEEISKIYHAKTALDKVSLSFGAGKIHGLLGENGAGKSTLAKIISGADTPSSGKIFIDGAEISFSKPADALKKGIAIVNQRPLLASTLTAEENIILSSSKKKSFFIPPKTPEELLALKKKWSPSLSLKTPVKDLGGNNRFYASLLSALLRHPDFLILDEPSAFLDMNERKSLYESLRQLAKNGTGILVITHSSSEAKSWCDTITVLKKGKLDAVYENPKDYTPEIISSVAYQNAGTENAREDSSTCLSLENVSCRPKDKPALLEASIKVDFSQITAVAGMKEAALGTLEDFVTGIDTAYSKGTVRFCDKKTPSKKNTIPAKKLTPAFLRKHNAAIVPSDKTFRASNPNLTVKEMLGTYSATKNETGDALKMISEAQVNISPEEKCSALSGGMLQRLILARELSQNPSLIILCNPMHGLDIEAQSKLVKKIQSLESEGKAVLIVGAADFPLTLCSRVYSIEGGKTKLTFEKKSGGNQ